MIELEPIRKFLAEEGILMCFHGPFRHSIIEELGKAVRKHLESEAVQKSAMADVFTVFIEAAQNVSSYAQRPHLDEPTRSRVQTGVLVICQVDGHYIVRCGNFLHPGDRGPLLERLDQLSGLDPAGLKALYKERMRAPLPPGETGAGLGLIRIARTASRPIEYKIQEAEDGLHFYSLTVVL